MSIIDQHISGCIRCGNTWTTYVGMSTNTFGMTEEQAQEHMRSFWENYSPYSLKMSDSPYLCPACGSLEVEFRNYRWSSVGGEENPLLDGKINTNPPDQIADALLTPMLEEREQVANAVIPEFKKREMLVKLEGKIAEINSSSMRDSEAFAKYYGPAMGYYVTQFKQDLALIMGRYRDNHLAFATFTDPNNFFDDHEIYLQIEDKKRFLQCLFFEVLLDQALYTSGFRPKKEGGCLYGTVKVVHILAAAGAMVNPYFLLLAASRWADNTDEADEDFEQLCWLFERELRRTMKGLQRDYLRWPKSSRYGEREWPLRGWPNPHDVKQDDVERTMPYKGNLGDLMRTGYFSNRQDFAKHEMFSKWITSIDRSIVRSRALDK